MDNSCVSMLEEHLDQLCLSPGSEIQELLVNAIDSVGTVALATIGSLSCSGFLNSMGPWSIKKPC
jgi:hypothetical protein